MSDNIWHDRENYASDWTCWFRSVSVRLFLGFFSLTVLFVHYYIKSILGSEIL